MVEATQKVTGKTAGKKAKQQRTVRWNEDTDRVLADAVAWLLALASVQQHRVTRTTVR